jgi:hypothetical protein
MGTKEEVKECYGNALVDLTVSEVYPSLDVINLLSGYSIYSMDGIRDCTLALERRSACAQRICAVGLDEDAPGQLRTTDNTGANQTMHGHRASI